MAARLGMDEHVTKLLSGGADVNQTDIFGWTALMSASVYGQEPTVRLLLEPPRLASQT